MLKMMPTIIGAQTMTTMMVIAGIQAMMLPPILLTARRTGFRLEGGREAQAGGPGTGAKASSKSLLSSGQQRISYRRGSGVLLTPRRPFRVLEDGPKAA